MPEPRLPRIGVDLASVNAEGLRGPPGGLRAVHYEFCIPADDQVAAEVRAIDATARLLHGSRGRIGCRHGQILVLGHTHQPAYRRVLDRLGRQTGPQRGAESRSFTHGSG